MSRYVLFHACVLSAFLAGPVQGADDVALMQHSSLESGSADDSTDDAARRAEAKERHRVFSMGADTLLEILSAQAWAGEKLLDLGDRAQLKEFGNRKMQLDKMKRMTGLEQEFQRMELLQKRLGHIATAEAQRRADGAAPATPAELNVAAMVKYLSRQNMDSERRRIFEGFVMQAWRDRLLDTTGRKTPLPDDWPADLDDAVLFAAGKDHYFNHNMQQDGEQKDYFSLLLKERSQAVERLTLARRANGTGFNWHEPEQLKRDWEVATKARSLVDVAEEGSEKYAAPDCASNPLNAYEGGSFALKITSANGHPNPRAWCYNHPQGPVTSRMTMVSEQTILRECLVKRDLPKFARVYYEQQVRAGLGEVEATYCFAEGLCDNDALQANSTMLDGEEACDMKYGSKTWRELGMRYNHEKEWSETHLISKEKGIRDQWPSKYFGMLSCALGHFHCDAVMCKETFCKNPYFKKAYSNWREKLESGEVSVEKQKSATEAIESFVRNGGRAK